VLNSLHLNDHLKIRHSGANSSINLDVDGFKVFFFPGKVLDKKRITRVE